MVGRFFDDFDLRWIDSGGNLQQYQRKLCSSQLVPIKQTSIVSFFVKGKIPISLLPYGVDYPA